MFCLSINLCMYTLARHARTHTTHAHTPQAYTIMGSSFFEIFFLPNLKLCFARNTKAATCMLSRLCACVCCDICALSPPCMLSRLRARVCCDMHAPSLPCMCLLLHALLTLMSVKRPGYLLPTTVRSVYIHRLINRHTQIDRCA